MPSQAGIFRPLARIVPALALFLRLPSGAQTSITENPPPVAPTNGTGTEATTAEEDGFDASAFFKRHLFGYEPMYYIAGFETPAAKFQFGLKYQLVSTEEHLGQSAPWLTGFHFAYTQTSLHDWEKPSSPFRDSSYKPEAFFAWRLPLEAAWPKTDLQAGFQHESNGKDGTDSRSLNIVYLQLQTTFGHAHGFELKVEPRGWFYVGDMSDNEDLPEYRGYASLRLTTSWKRRLQIAATGQIGSDWDKGRLSIDASYPLFCPKTGGLGVYLYSQYFLGYGESLLEFNRRSSAFRAGFALFR
jgi:outer membrane phospholipase A